MTPGASRTKVHDRQIQLPDGSWIDPTLMPSGGPPMLLKPNSMPNAPGVTMAQAQAGRTAEVTLPEIAVEPPKPAAPVPNPTVVPSTGGGGSARLPLGEYYSKLEQSRGLPAGFLAKTRAIESSNGTRLQNPNSSAGGPFQFIDKTAQAMKLNNRFDEYESAEKAADLAAQNAKIFRARTGRDPDGPDLYGLHQQGPKGYVDLVNGKAPGGDAQALNGGNGLNASGFLGKIRGLYDKAVVKNVDGYVPPENPVTAAMARPSPGANRGQGPTVANAQAIVAANAPAPEVQGPTAPTPEQAAAAAKANTYNGGLVGLLGGGDPLAPGMGKDVMGKLGDMAGGGAGGAFATAAKGLAALAGGNEQKQPDRPIVVNPDNVNVPNTALMSLLDIRKRRAAAMMGGA